MINIQLFYNYPMEIQIINKKFAMLKNQGVLL